MTSFMCYFYFISIGKFRKFAKVYGNNSDTQFAKDSPEAYVHASNIKLPLPLNGNLIMGMCGRTV